MTRLLNKTILTVIFLLITGAFFRLYNLNWGSPYYFHPDERNIAYSVSQLEFPDQMNPRFFAYGSLPIYLIYATGLVSNSVNYCLSQAENCLTNGLAFHNLFNVPDWKSINHLTFEQAIIISRIFSAVLSILLIPLIYLTGKKLHSEHVGLLAAFFATFSVGFIQFAHFGTFELWITFFSLLLYYNCLNLLVRTGTKSILVTALITGVLTSVKISNLALLPLPLIAILLPVFKDQQKLNFFKSTLAAALKKLPYMAAAITIIALVFISTNPYIIYDFPSFRNSMQYESSVALGTQKVFYTQEFFNTLPVYYQFVHIYPFLLNPLITAIFIPSLFFVVLKSARHKLASYLLLAIFYLLIFLSQSFFFAKWTRYMVPTMPFIYLIIALFMVVAFAKIINKKTKLLVFCLTGFICLIFTYSYYYSVLVKPDTRIESAKWAASNLETGKPVMSEVYDLGVIAFSDKFPDITLCDLYSLEQNTLPCNNTPLQTALNNSSYIILPSERIMKMSYIHKKNMPERYSFYSSLFSGTAGYTLVYKTPCDTACKILYLGDPLFSLEQTANVFDRPTVYIFSKK